MAAREFGWMKAAFAVLAIVACGARPLDPNGGQIATPPPTSDDIAALRAVSGPDALLIVASNAGVVTGAPDGAPHVFEKDPGTLVSAAATVGMRVCSVEPVTIPAQNRVPDHQWVVSVAGAMDICATFDYGDMIARLSGLKSASTVVIAAANTAITVRSTNGGINYFYDDDILRLWRAARALYVPVCVIVPDPLALPTPPAGQTAGPTVDEALRLCGL
jgi:hypothetical protein